MGITNSNFARQAVGVTPAPAAGCGWEAFAGVYRVTSWPAPASAADGRNPLGPAAALCATAGAAGPRSRRAGRGPLAGPLAGFSIGTSARRRRGGASAHRCAPGPAPGSVFRGRLPPRRARGLPPRKAAAAPRGRAAELCTCATKFCACATDAAPVQVLRMCDTATDAARPTRMLRLCAGVRAEAHRMKTAPVRFLTFDFSIAVFHGPCAFAGAVSTARAPCGSAGTIRRAAAPLPGGSLMAGRDGGRQGPAISVGSPVSPPPFSSRHHGGRARYRWQYSSAAAWSMLAATLRCRQQCERSQANIPNNP